MQALAVPCVLMRDGTSRGPFFLRDWLPHDDAARDQALIGAIGASDLLQEDGVGVGRQVTDDGSTGIDGVAGTAAPIQLDFPDAWGAVTGAVFTTGQRIDHVLGLPVICIGAAMPLMLVRARNLGLTGRGPPAELDAMRELLARLEAMRCLAAKMMGPGDMSASVIPKPVTVSRGDDGDSITSRCFTPRRCHASHAVTGAVGVAAAFALPGTVASSTQPRAGARSVAVLHPQGRISVAVAIEGAGAAIRRAALVRARRARSRRARCTFRTMSFRHRPHPRPKETTP